MTCRLLLLVAAFGMLSVASGQDNDPPSELAGFLKPGTKVGILPHHESATFSVIIFSPKDFEIAKDSRVLEPDELVAKYPEVAAAKEKELEKFAASLKNRRDNPPRGKKFGTPEARMHVHNRLLLFTVQHLGTDYFIVDEEKMSRRAFANRFLSSIRWQDGLQFSTFRELVDAD